MANEWIYSDGAACYNSDDAGFAIATNQVLEIGKLSVIEFTISNMTQGKLVLDSLYGKPEYTEDGDYQAIGVAISNNLTFIGEAHIGGTFDGCIDDVTSRQVPFITIKDTDGNIVFEQVDESIVTASGDNIQYDIDWTEIEEGCYQIYFSYGLDYVSDCISLQLDHGCTLLLTWTNDDNAYGINYEDLNMTHSMRVKAKLWKPGYAKEKSIFKDNAGNRTIIRSDTSKENILTISEMPEYMHDALAIGLEHDNFYIDGIRHTNDEEEYTPQWRKSSQLAPVEVTMAKDQILRNSNC
jgi:hypothetical protein